jgi:DNA-directed RNA polymerase subunit RPC12/RpoP
LRQRPRKKKKTWFTKTGVEVRSDYEKRVLDNLTERGYEYEYEPIKIHWSERLRGFSCSQCGGKEIVKGRTYTPDVRVRGRLVELKGRLTSRNRKILSGVRETGDVSIRHILFQRDNTFTPALKRTPKYSDWARLGRWNWAIGEEIPDAWLS